VIARIDPVARADVPQSVREIRDRLLEISFNAASWTEIAALGLLLTFVELENLPLSSADAQGIGKASRRSRTWSRQILGGNPVQVSVLTGLRVQGCGLFRLRSGFTPHNGARPGAAGPELLCNELQSDRFRNCMDAISRVELVLRVLKMSSNCFTPSPSSFAALSVVRPKD
jgi:hypothetical protein